MIVNLPDREEYVVNIVKIYIETNLTTLHITIFFLIYWKEYVVKVFKFLLQIVQI